MHPVHHSFRSTFVLAYKQGNMMTLVLEPGFVFLEGPNSNESRAVFKHFI